LELFLEKLFLKKLPKIKQLNVLRFVILLLF